MNRPPMSRPSYTMGYIPIVADGYNYQMRIGSGQTVKTMPRLNACDPHFNIMKAQYGAPCYRRPLGYKPDIYLA